MRLAALAPLFLLLPAPAAAQAETFTLPAGCTAYLTVQTASCTVSHHFTCENDPDGLQRRVDLDEEGLTYAGAIDAETQWIESYHLFSGHSERLEPDPRDPASLTELLETGADSYDFRTLSDEIGTTRYVGADQLTGQTVVIDGVELLETEYRIRSEGPDGTEMWRSAGNEFVHPEWRMFLSGTSTTTTPDESWESDKSPVEFIFPGEAGFLSANPKHGCGATLSSWTGAPG